MVVVNHDAGAALGAFVDSLAAEDVARVVVVDNASRDGSVEALAASDRLRVVRLATNLGYGAGVNRGLAVTDTDLVLVSNPDVAVRAGTLATLAAVFATDPTVAIAGPVVLDAGGNRYPSARRFPSYAAAAAHAVLGLLRPGNRFSRRYRMDDLDLTGPVAVDWVSGACFMARRQALTELGGFDESYFMYVEDLDLCWRAHRAGWRVVFVPDAVVTHLQGLSTARRPYRMLLAHHRSAFHFARRSAEGPSKALLPGVAVLLAARLAVAWFRQFLGTVSKKEAPGD